MTKLSKNFSLEEMTFSETATRKGISNKPTKIQLEKLTTLCDNLLQPVRDKFGSTVVTSGLRGKELNELIGGSTKSQHCKGEAADFHCSRHTRYKVAKWISENLEFDQLILEGFTEDNPDRGWIHCSYAKKNRKQVLIATFEKGKKTVYSPYSF